jgi:hypothetical protein
MRLVYVGGCLFAALVLALPARADALLQRALAPAAEDAMRVWNVQRTGLDYDGAGNLKSKTVAQFDGTQPEGKRWALLSINGATPTKSQRADFNDIYKKNALPPTYGLVQTVVTSNALKLGETATQAMYRVTSLPAGSTAVRGLDLSKYTIADVTVDKHGVSPFVSEVRVYAPKEFRPMAGGKVKRLERILRFAMGKDGVPVLVEHSMISDASILFKSITVRSIAQFSHQAAIAQLASANLRVSPALSN